MDNVPFYDLAVIGATPAGLTLAEDARAAGVGRVVVLQPNGQQPVPPPEQVDLFVHDPVRHIGRRPSGHAVLTADDVCVVARHVVVAELPHGVPRRPSFPIPSGLDDRVHDRFGPWADPDDDVLVIGNGESAVTSVRRLAATGAAVVLVMSAAHSAQLSRIAQDTLADLERSRKLTVFTHSAVVAIELVGDHPMVRFGDRRTPDLQFDHVLFELGDDLATDPLDVLGIEVEPDVAEAVSIVRDRAIIWPRAVAADTLESGTAWRQLAARLAPDWTPPPPPTGHEEVEGLRERYYNATITHLDTAHSDLWILRVKPDHEDTSHVAGQYATLGLGYWEPRADAAPPVIGARFEKLVRRSYSISSPIFDRFGYLFDPHRSADLEFYIVLVPLSPDRTPELTPRLALKRPGDRIYLGPKVAGRYTLDPVTDPTGTVVFMSTGTGEAPHNAMVVELLRKGHVGPVVSAVTVRHETDLAYRDAHRRLEQRFVNYSYVPMPTREPDVPKRYLQDLIRSGDLDDLVGGLDPETAHVFLCGNPAMIGAPTWNGEVPSFPQPPGVVELLMERGFMVDRRGAVGTVHFEEYW